MTRHDMRCGEVRQGKVWKGEVKFGRRGEPKWGRMIQQNGKEKNLLGCDRIRWNKMVRMGYDRIR